MRSTTQRRATAALVATGMGAALLAAGVSSPAEAATGELRYACQWKGGTEELVATMSADAPSEAFYSSASGTGGFSMTLATDASLPARIAGDLWADGGRTVAGRIAEPYTVSDGRDPRGPSLPVASSIAPVSLGDQSTPTSVALRDQTARFGEVRFEPGYLSFRAREALELRLSVTKEGGAVEQVTIPCTRLTAPGTWPEINRVAWVAPTATAVEAPEQVEFGEDVSVVPSVTPVRGTAAGTLTVSSGAASSAVTVAGKTVPVATLTGLTAGSHALRATFVPQDTTFYRGSTATAPVVQVSKAASRVETRVLSREAGKRAVLRVVVRGVHDTISTGDVRVTLRPVGRAGKRVKVRTLDRSGSDVVRFAKLDRGRYKVVVKYRGDANHLMSSTTKTFRAKRS